MPAGEALARCAAKIDQADEQSADQTCEGIDQPFADVVSKRQVGEPVHEEEAEHADESADAAADDGSLALHVGDEQPRRRPVGPEDRLALVGVRVDDELPTARLVLVAHRWSSPLSPASAGTASTAIGPDPVPYSYGPDTTIGTVGKFSRGGGDGTVHSSPREFHGFCASSGTCAVSGGAGPHTGRAAGRARTTHTTTESEFLDLRIGSQVNDEGFFTADVFGGDFAGFGVDRLNDAGARDEGSEDHLVGSDFEAIRRFFTAGAKLVANLYFFEFTELGVGELYGFGGVAFETGSRLQRDDVYRFAGTF